MHGVGCVAVEPGAARLHRLLGAPRLTLPGRRRQRVPTPHWCKPKAVLVPPHAEGERMGTSVADGKARREAGDDSGQDIDSRVPESSFILPPTPSQVPVVCDFRMGVPKPGQRRGEIPGPHLLALGGPLGGKSERRDASGCALRPCSTVLRVLPSTGVEGSATAPPTRWGADAERCGDIREDLCDGEDLPPLLSRTSLQTRLSCGVLLENVGDTAPGRNSDALTG